MFKHTYTNVYISICIAISGCICCICFLLYCGSFIENIWQRVSVCHCELFEVVGERTVVQCFSKAFFKKWYEVLDLVVIFVSVCLTIVYVELKEHSYVKYVYTIHAACMVD